MTALLFPILLTQLLCGYASSLTNTDERFKRKDPMTKRKYLSVDHEEQVKRCKSYLLS